MSLLGKILALLNVLGAIALFTLMIMDYSKRQQWAHSVLQHELILEGMPLDEDERDAQGRPKVHALPKKTVEEHFSSVGGNGQPTQVDEVNRVQAEIKSNLNGLATPREQTYQLARLLLPLSDSYLEREEMLAARHYFATDARYAELQRRYRTAFDEARARVADEAKAGPKLTFEEAMFVAMRALGGEPSDALTMTFVRQLPTDPALLKAARFEDAWDKAIKLHHDGLVARLDEKFARALLGPNAPAGSSGQSAEVQKRTIARLLFALAQPFAEDKAADDPKLKAIPDRNSAAYAQELSNTSAYQERIRRVYAVCGIKTTLSAIAEEVAEVRKEALEARQAQDQDLINFVSDHGALVEELRDRYELLRTEIDRVADNRTKLDEQKKLVDLRKMQVEKMKEELRAAREETKKEADELATVSKEVLRLRLEVRDVIKQTEEAEKEIRRLEGIIRARENPRRVTKD